MSPADTYLFKANNRNAGKCWYEICSQLVTCFTHFSSVYIVDFEQVNVSCVSSAIFRYAEE